jgi:hypothetical protein
MEWRHELALQRRALASYEHLILTSDMQLHLSLYSITSKLSMIPCRDTIQRVGVLPTLRKSSPSSKLL